MKKTMTLILCLMLLSSPAAFANPFTAPARPISSWTLSDGMELVGEDVFDAMLTEVKQNIVNNAGEDIGFGFTYSPGLYAIIDSLMADGVNPHEALYHIGDTSPDMNIYFAALKAKGYISEIPSDYTEGIANEIRKIQYAAGLPATGEITTAIALGLLTDSVIPSNQETLKLLEKIPNEISDKCRHEMEKAQNANALLADVLRKNTDVDVDAAALSCYSQAHEYIPSFVVRYRLYSPAADSISSASDSRIKEETMNIISNTSTLMYTLFYCAEHNLRHDFAGYAAEYRDLLKK